LQLRWSASGRWQAITCTGEVVDQPAWIEGYPHAISERIGFLQASC
jgi:hypothetical protein